MLKNRFCFIVLFLSFNSAFSQLEFQQVLGGDKEEEAQALLTVDDGIFVVGNTKSCGAGKSDMYLIKSGKDGKISWSKTYGGRQDDIGTGIVKTKDNNYLLLGHSSSFEDEYSDICVIKINPQGEVIWSKIYGLNNSEYSNMIISTSDNGFLILGESLIFKNDKKNSDILLIKINADGVIQWSHQLGGDNNDYAYSISELKEGGYIIGGETNSYGAGDFDFYMLKLDAKGSVVWSKTYGGASTDFGRYALAIADGGFLFGGSTQNFEAKEVDFCFIKTDNNGNIVWAKRYGGDGADYLLSMCDVDRKGFLSVGYSNSAQGVSEDVCLIYTDYITGKVSWARLYGSKERDAGASVCYGENNQILIGGSTNGFKTVSDDIYMISTTLDKRPLIDCNHNYFFPFYSHNITVKTGQGHEQAEIKCNENVVTVKASNCNTKSTAVCVPEN